MARKSAPDGLAILYTLLLVSFGALVYLALKERSVIDHRLSTSISSSEAAHEQDPPRVEEETEHQDEGYLP